MTKREHGWLKLYYSVLDDRKVMALPPADRWFWIELLCIAGEHDQGGYLPDLEGISFRLDRSLSVSDRCRIGVELLIDRNLIDKEKGGASGFRLKIHDWVDWQPKSGTSTERVKRFRERDGNGDETRSSHARAKTRLDYRQTDRQTAGVRPREDSISSKSEGQKGQEKPVWDPGEIGLRPMLEPPEKGEPEPRYEPPRFQRANGGPPKIAQHEHSAHLLDRIVANYERSLEKPANRAKVAAIWETLTASEQAATAEGFLVWLMELTTKPGDEGYDPKFIKTLDKLFEEGMLKRKIVSPGVDRYGTPLADIRGAILEAWLQGQTYGMAQI